MLRCLLLVSAFLATMPAAADEQRSFPINNESVGVTYVDAGGPGHPTGCVVSITAALPTLALSINVYSNNKAGLVAGRQSTFIDPKLGSDAGIAVGPDFFFGKVSGTRAQGTFQVVIIDLIPGSYGTAMDAAYKAINRIVCGANVMSVVADDAQIVSGPVPQQAGVGNAVIACQRYMISRP